MQGPAYVHLLDLNACVFCVCAKAFVAPSLDKLARNPWAPVYSSASTASTLEVVKRQRDRANREYL